MEDFLEKISTWHIWEWQFYVWQNWCSAFADCSWVETGVVELVIGVGSIELYRALCKPYLFRNSGCQREETTRVIDLGSLLPHSLIAFIKRSSSKGGQLIPNDLWAVPNCTRQWWRRLHLLQVDCCMTLHHTFYLMVHKCNKKTLLKHYIFRAPLKQ